MKKTICLLLCLCTLFSLTACQGNESPETTETTEITEPTEDTTIPEETIPLVTEPIVTEPPEFTVTMSFTGDMMLAAYTGHSYKSSFDYYADTQEPSYFLEKVKHVFEADDFTIVNLENVFTDRNLKGREKGGSRVFWFKSKTANAEILTCASVEGVSLANNHTYDFGNAGYEDTIKAVADAGLNYGSEDKIMYFEKEGFKIAVICSGLWNESQANDITKMIKEAETQSHFQVVFYHGGTEKEHAPEKWRVRASRALVDGGADLVLGNHPHVLQPREIYNGVEIIYSLGNFCYGGHTAPQNRTMIYQVNLNIDKESLFIKDYGSNIIPCYVYTGNSNNFQPAIIEQEDEIKRVLDFMNGFIELPY